MTGINIEFIIKTLLFTSIFLGSSYCAGKNWVRIFKWNFNSWLALPFGFIFNLAFVQIVGWLFMLFRWNNVIFSNLVICLLLLQIIFALADKKREKYRIDITMDKVCVFFMLALEIGLTFFIFRSDADDSFYVSTVNLFAQSSVLNPYDASFGIETLGTVPLYDIETWEAFIAVFARVFQFDAATMMHTVLLPSLLIISAAAYIFLGRTLFDEKRKEANLFYILLSIFFLVGGYSVLSQGSFLLSRLWQGKALYLHIVLPVMIGIMLQFFKKKDSYLFVELGLCVLAGISLNPTSTYLFAFQILFMLMIIAIYQKSFKALFHSLPALFIALFFALIILIRTKSFDSQLDAATALEGNIVIESFFNFWNTGINYVFLFMLFAIIIFFIGNKEAKTYFVFFSIALICFCMESLDRKYYCRKSHDSTCLLESILADSCWTSYQLWNYQIDKIGEKAMVEYSIFYISNVMFNSSRKMDVFF